MTGKVIIVTGANSGLGYEVSRYLCEGGNDVILACRNEERANRAIEKIKRQNPNALATYMQLDLGSMESIRKFVDDFHETGKKVNVLINNAGLMPSCKDPKRQYTVDNFEATMGTNHLGHFLLTNLLLEDLKKTGGDGGDSRIVMVTSGHHDPDSMKRKSHVQPLDFENFFLTNEASYNGMQAYKNSKVAVVMTSYEMARKLEGSGVTVNCVDPGFVPGTDIMRNSSGAQKFFSRYIMHGLLRFTKMTRSVQQGAQAISGQATDEKYKEISGKYFRDGAEVKSSEESLDEDKQKKLWELSGGYTHLEGFEPIEVPPPPVEEEKKEEKKDEAKEGEAKEDGEAKTDENKTDETKTEEQKDDDKKDEDKKEDDKKEDDKKEEEKKEEKDNKTEDAKPEEPASENKEEEKKE